MRKIILSIVSVIFILSLSVSPFAATAQNTATDEVPASSTLEVSAEPKPTYEPLYTEVGKKGSSFAKIGETKQAELYMAEVTDCGFVFALKNLETGAIWYSVKNDTKRITGDVPMNYLALFELANISYVTGIHEITSTVQNSTASSVQFMSDPNNYTVDSISNGVRITINFDDGTEALGFKIPLEFTVVDDHMDVSVVFEEIETREDCTSALLSVGVMKYMASSEFSDENYTLVPDGSGSLFYSNCINSEGTAQTYSTNIYGQDSIVNTRSSLGQTSTNALPVYGVKDGNKACFAIASKGDAVAKFHVTSATEMGYSQAYFDFIYNVYDEFQAAVIYSQEKIYSKIAVHNTQIDRVTVSFYALGGDDADYVGMAETYREYLVKNGADSDVSEDVSLYLETIGAVTKPESSFGLIVDKTKPVTTFEQATAMVTELKDAGVESINLRYSGWLSGGLESTANTTAKIESVVGDEESLATLKQSLQEANGQLFLDLDLVRMYETKFGWSANNAAIRNALNEYALQYAFALNDGRRVETDYYYLITPSRLQEQMDSFNKKSADYDLDAISLGTLGHSHYSDFIESERFSDAQNTSDLMTAVLAGCNQDKTVMVDTGYGYSLTNTDVVIGAPMYDSGYDLNTQEVPFYQIALHGVVTYTETAHNLTTRTGTQLLRELETGANPYYLLTGVSPAVFSTTRYDYIVSSEYDVWKESAISDYQTIAGVLNGHNDSYITDHKILSKDGNVRATTYGDELTVVVNYGSTDVKLSNGQTVKAESYITCSAGEV